MKFLAHRGDSKHFPENSLEAFHAVLKHPQTGRALIGIELDIQFTADKQIPVLHDTVLRGSSGEERAVRELTLSELRTGRFPGAGPGVAELEQVLELVAHNTELCIEVKDGGYDLDGFANVLVDALQHYKPRGDVVLSSFSPGILRRLSECTSHLDVRYGFIFAKWNHWTGLGADVRSVLHYAHPEYCLLLEDPSRLAALGLPVQCWTVDDPADVQALLALEGSERIRAVMTNNIALSDQFAEQ